jgi:hypothetical protein
MSAEEILKERTITQELLELLRSESEAMSESGRVRLWAAVKGECLRHRPPATTSPIAGRCAACGRASRTKFCSSQCFEDHKEQKRSSRL